MARRVNLLATFAWGTFLAAKPFRGTKSLPVLCLRALERILGRSDPALEPRRIAH